MSGIAQKLVGNDLFQRFTADGTWKKPAGIKMVVLKPLVVVAGVQKQNPLVLLVEEVLP